MVRFEQIRVNYLILIFHKYYTRAAPNHMTHPVSSPAAGEIFTVSRLNRAARRILEGGLSKLWVEGEISNLARPGSGHIYFTLKDDQAQIRCAMFRSSNQQLSFRPNDGVQVVVRARVSIYEARGDYQLIVEHMEDAGEGLLRRKFEELKTSLSEAGLFDEQHKKLLPQLPGCIGIITSPSGAAIRDILHILKRRYPIASVIIYPTRVQGAGANDEIVNAIDLAIQRDECDVLIVARGGGSLEDLWSFNEANVARAIYACPLPIISGVGHEVDVTIADLVADVRAPTPSGAAELVAPDKDELLRTLAALNRRAMLSLRRLWSMQQQSYTQLKDRLNRMHPGSILDQLRQRADDLTRRLVAGTQDLVDTQQADRIELTLRLKKAAPTEKLARLMDRLNAYQRQLASEVRRIIDSYNTRVAVAAGSLNGVSPLATLERGYAIVRDCASGTVVRDATRLSPGDSITTQLAKGQIDATIDRITTKNPS